MPINFKANSYLELCGPELGNVSFKYLFEPAPFKDLTDPQMESHAKGEIEISSVTIQDDAGKEITIDFSEITVHQVGNERQVKLSTKTTEKVIDLERAKGRIHMSYKIYEDGEQNLGDFLPK